MGVQQWHPSLKEPLASPNLRVADTVISTRLGTCVISSHAISVSGYAWSTEENSSKPYVVFMF